MTDRRHPLEDQACALVDDERFAQFLDDCSARTLGWTHNRFSARRWLERECEVESLGHLATDPQAAAAFDQIARRFALWDRNQELPV